MALRTVGQAVAWGDEWMRRAIDAETELQTLRAELEVYKLGYKIAMSLAKPEYEAQPKFADAEMV